MVQTKLFSDLYFSPKPFFPCIGPVILNFGDHKLKSWKLETKNIPEALCQFGWGWITRWGTKGDKEIGFFRVPLGFLREPSPISLVQLETEYSTVFFYIRSWAFRACPISTFRPSSLLPKQIEAILLSFNEFETVWLLFISWSYV